MNTQIICFYKLLSLALHPENKEILSDSQKEEIQKELPSLLKLARKHNVLLFIYDALCMCNMDAPLLKEDSFQKEIVSGCLHNYDMLFFTQKILAFLKAHSISFSLLKGISLLDDYEKPECRNTSDIDILVSDPIEYQRTKELLMSYGFCTSGHSADHHEELLYYENGKTYLLELHNKAVNSTGDARDEKIKDIFDHALPLQKKLSFAAISYQCFSSDCNLLYLLLHMLQHFTSLGFGAKLLCDWTVFLEHHAKEIDFVSFHAVLQDLGLFSFCQTMTELCIRYLGLQRKILEQYGCTFLNADIDQTLLERVLHDIHNAGEFGIENRTRILISHKSSFSSTIAKGHRQMKIYFPKASHCFLFWPVLWSITFYRFVYNNHHLRNIDTKTILENTKQRQELFKALHLAFDHKKKED